MKKMKIAQTLALWLFSILSVLGQNLESEMLYPDTLRSTQDSFFVNSPKFSKIWSHPILRKDTLNLGTSGYKGVSMKIWTDIDTIQIPHVNFPFKQLIKIPILSPTDTALCIIRFQANSSNFGDDYAEKATGRFDIQIPEIYELANIALYLSNCSEQTNNRPNSEYTQKVDEYFSPVRNHKLIQVLNRNCEGQKYWNTYYGFRENSLCFSYDNMNFLHYDTEYKNVYWDDASIFGGQFRNMLYLIQDFSDQSNFREFYRENRMYYRELVNRQNELLPIKQMWEWLEHEFPQKMDSYKIVFSSLIAGSHSTQKFYKGFFREPDFQECIMFINSSESIDSNLEYTEQVKEGLMSGIVFTEIDHNYVNPTSKENLDAIKELMKNKDFWATKDAQQNYSSEYAIFNEYMTHSVFCLYAKEIYAKEISHQIISKRIGLMNRRGYSKFEEFNKILLEMMKNSDLSVYDLYSEIIDEMKTIE
jgi:hypothetical protein